VPDSQNYVVILRFFGTTRSSSNIVSCLESIIDQLAIFFDFETYDEQKLTNNRSILELKEQLLTHFLKIKEKFPEKKIVIFLDSIDQLVSVDDSTSLQDVTWILKEFPDNVKMIYSTLPYYGGILKSIKENGITDQENFLKIKRLDKETSMLIMNEWLKAKNRYLTVEQFKVVEDILVKSTLYPLYIKLIFDIVCRWTSYYQPANDSKFFSCLNIDECIKYLFKFYEERHGKILFSRCCLYLTFFANGLSESELEDILSIDDEVLYSVFTYHSPPSRRFPLFLWILIKNDIREYLNLRKMDGTLVISWFHRRFIQSISDNYLSNLSTKEIDDILFNIIDYFTEKWNQTPKPFVHTEYVKNKLGLAHAESQAIRKTKPQNIKFSDDEGNINYNHRKLNELPFFILKLNNLKTKISYLIEHVYFDYDFISTKATLYDLDFLSQMSREIWSICLFVLQGDETLNDEDLEFKRSVMDLSLVHYFYESNQLILQEFPQSFAFQLCSKLQHFCINLNRFEEFLKSSVIKSFKSCALKINSNYLPLFEKTNAKTLVMDNSYFNKMISLHKTNYIFANSEKIYLINASKSGTRESNDMLELNDLLPDVNFKKDFYVYLNEKVKNLNTSSGKALKFKNLNGGIIISQRKILYSISFNEKLLFKKVYLSRIDFFLISVQHVVVKTEKQFEILDVKSGTSLAEKHFTSNIKYMCSNTSKQHAFTESLENFKIFIVVALANGEINLYNFDTVENNLVHTAIIFACGLMPTSLISDSFFHPENELYQKEMSSNKAICRFGILFANLTFFILNVNLNDYHKPKCNILCIKIDRDDSVFKKLSKSLKNIVFQDFYKGKILLRIGMSCFVYDIGI
jgi:hypothetical protein